MNDACSVMIKRMEEKFIPAIKNNCQIKSTVLKQVVSGKSGTLPELDLGQFTQEELVYAYELCVGLYHLTALRRSLGLDPDNYIG